MTSKPLPADFHTVTPYLVVDGASRLIEFMSSAFQAKERYRDSLPDGMIQHAQVLIGNSIVMLSDARAEYPAMPGMLFLYVDSADEAYDSAIAAGATSLRPPQDETHGDRMAGVLDPFGIQWWVANPIG
jgi:uncharacterized glyoxalase superfamily protein PhnB